MKNDENRFLTFLVVLFYLFYLCSVCPILSSLRISESKWIVHVDTTRSRCSLAKQCPWGPGLEVSKELYALALDGGSQDGVEDGKGMQRMALEKEKRNM